MSYNRDRRKAVRGHGEGGRAEQPVLLAGMKEEEEVQTYTGMCVNVTEYVGKWGMKGRCVCKGTHMNSVGTMYKAVCMQVNVSKSHPYTATAE